MEQKEQTTQAAMTDVSTPAQYDMDMVGVIGYRCLHDTGSSLGICFCPPFCKCRKDMCKGSLRSV